VESGKQMPIAEELLTELKRWHAATQFSAPGDWVFASPVQLRRLLWSYDQIWRVYQKAAKAAGIAAFGTHTLHHTYRSWLDAVGTTLAVQQKLMRHADIRATMNADGDVVTDEMEQAHKKVVNLALNRSRSGLQWP
jgi:integrase